AATRQDHARSAGASADAVAGRMRRPRQCFGGWQISVILSLSLMHLRSSGSLRQAAALAPLGTKTVCDWIVSTPVLHDAGSRAQRCGSLVGAGLRNSTLTDTVLVSWSTVSTGLSKLTVSLCLPSTCTPCSGWQPTASGVARQRTVSRKRFAFSL